MNIIPIKTTIFREGDDLISFIGKYVRRIPNRSILAITSKIVALAEGRTAPHLTERHKVRLIKSESQLAIRTKYAWLTVKDGTFMATAGIDESNGDGKLILLPQDSFAAAKNLRRALMSKYRIKHLGIVITDSRCIPLRAGIIGVALGYAGFCGVKDYRRELDLFGRPFHFSRVDIADSIAAAAVLTMGEGNESQPLALANNAPVKFMDRTNRRELAIDVRDDLYQPLFAKIGRSGIFHSRKRKSSR